jgi:hypothetical protein
MKIEDSYQDATVVPLDAVALIVRADGTAELGIPKDEELEWHATQMALAQLAIRFMNDPEWVQELTEELKASAS